LEVDEVVGRNAKIEMRNANHLFRTSVFAFRIFLRPTLFSNNVQKAKEWDWQSLFRSYGRYFAEFLNASYPEHLGLLDHPTGVGLRYGLMRLSVAMVFSESEGEKLIPQKGNIWDPCSALSADLPTEINALHVPRAVDTHALCLLFRHNAPRMKISLLDGISVPFHLGEVESVQVESEK
jgi:hypothetical protein